MTGRLTALALLTIFVTILVLIVLAVGAEDADSQEEPPPTVTTDPAPGLATTLAIEAAEREARHWQARWQARGQIIRRQRANLRHVIHASASWGNHWLERAFQCIRRNEGAWWSVGPVAEDGSRYRGGLQMDSTFQRSYGREFLRAFGPANRWPAAVQITVAIRAYLSGRGFGPWSKTARECGLR